jgi:hypothetical protein
MPSSYYPQGVITPNLGLALYCFDEVLANNFILLDAFAGTAQSIQINGSVIPQTNFVDSATVAFTVAGNNVTANAVAGSSVDVNGAPIAAPNFNNTVPAAPGGATNVLWQVSGGSVSAYVIIPAAGTFPVTITAVASNWLNSYSSVTGVFTANQPTFSDLSVHPTTLAGYGITDAISSGVMTTLGDIIYENNVPTPARLAGNTTATREFLRSQGAAGAATAPVWDTLLAGDIPNLPASIITSGVLALARGGNTFALLGDTIYGGAAAAPTVLSGNITTTKMYLSQTGTSAVSAAPAWAQINYADITGTTPTPPSGSVLWSALGSAAAALTLNNANYATTFNQTSAVNWTWANTTVATALTTNASPPLVRTANYWTGSASAVDTWTMGTSLAAGTNGTSTLSIAHTGSTGIALVQMPTISVITAATTADAASITILGSGLYSSSIVKLSANANTGFPALDEIFPSGGIFRTGEVSVLGTNDIFFQVIPASSSGYGYLEAYNASGLAIGTGNNNLVLVRPNRTTVTAFSVSGVLISSGVPLQWPFCSISRIGNGSLAVGNGTQGDTTGQLTLGSLVSTAAAPTVAASQVGFGGTVSATANTTGGGLTLPLLAAGYLIVNVAGTNFKVPYFAA